MIPLPLPRASALGLAAAILWSATAAGEPVKVRFPEGTARGFLTVRTADGGKVADGDVFQVSRRDAIESRLIFRFADGSLYDETVVFAQRRVFTMLQYRIAQRGPAFPAALEVSLDRRSSRYAVRHRPAGAGREQALDGTIALPPDAYNGMTSTLLKNLPGGARETVHLVAFTPEPRLVKLHLAPAGEESVRVGDAAMRATRYAATPQVDGLLGFVARLLDKQPPVLHYWILRDKVPAFVKFEGPFFMGGPVWLVASSYHTEPLAESPKGSATPRVRQNASRGAPPGNRRAGTGGTKTERAVPQNDLPAPPAPEYIPAQHPSN